MIRRAVRTWAAWLPVGTWLALVALVVGIAVVELGVRDAAPDALGAPLPMPGVLRGSVEALRSVPLTAIDEPRAAAIASGVVFGRTEHVAAQDEEAFLASGLWHLLAASGQNVALVGGCCVLLARSVGAGRTTGSVLALVAIPAYVLVVGGGASIVRAGVMGELAIVAWLSGRIGDMRHVLLVAAAAITWCWPGVHRSLGMQLSFACVAALAWRAVPLTRAATARGVPEWLAASLVASGLCSLATAPILVLRTGAAPFAGTVANVVAVPIAGVLLVVGLAGSLLALIASGVLDVDVSRWALAPAGLLASMLQRIAERAAELPAAQVDATPLVIAASVTAMALVWRTPRGRIQRRVAFVAAGALVVACGASVTGLGRTVATPLARSTSAAPVTGTRLRIGVLDIGQGDATLLATRGHAVLVDTGPPDGRVVERVRDLGVTRLDGIVLTHDSLDHRGGFDAAFDALQPRWVAMPRGAPGPWERIRSRVPGIIELCAGDHFGLEPDVRIEVLHPRCDGRIAPKTGDLHNDGAMVLLVTRGRTRVLLPADAEAPVLLGLGLPHLDVLRVSHHGSDDPALPELLARTSPQVAAISVGEGNDYGHPRATTLDALDAAGVRTFRTDRDGTVALETDGDRVELLG